MADLPPTNLQRLLPSRKRLRAGDIFVARPQGHPFVFGRVVSTDAHALQIGGAVLIYIYDAWSDDKAQVPDVSCDRLLIPPAMVNRLGWSRGYFEVVAHRPLAPGDVLTVHCFVSDAYTAGPRYFDEDGHELPGPTEPVGQRGLGNYRTVDDDISRTLGLPPAPDP